MGKVRARMKPSLPPPRRLSGCLARWTVFTTVVLSAVYHSECLTVESVSVDDSDCPVTLTCEANFSTTPEMSGIRATWLLNGKDVGEEGLRSTQDFYGSTSYYLTLPCNVSNFGNLTCVVLIEGEQNLSISANKSIPLTFRVAPSISDLRGDTVNGSHSAALHCSAHGYPAPEIEWIFNGEELRNQTNKMKIMTSQGSTFTSSTLELKSAQRSDNGTYVCHAFSSSGRETKPTALFVQTKPEVSIDYALGVGNGSLYLNWTLNNGNLPITSYTVKFMKISAEQLGWRYSHVKPNVSATSLLIDGLDPDAAYKLKLEAENAMGQSGFSEYSEAVKTLSSEAEYVPVADIKGSTSNSFTLGWTAPPEGIRHLIGHYEAAYKDKTEKTVKVPAFADRPPVHLFTDLKPATMYYFKVRACQRYTSRCGIFSELVNGATIDGKPSAPNGVTVSCGRDEHGNNFYVNVTWEPPSQPNGQLVHFSLTLRGEAQFINERRQEQREEFGPMTQNVDGTKFFARFDQVPPNTHYRVDVKAESRTQHGETATGGCRMPPSVPDKENLHGVAISRYHRANAWGLQVSLPRVSQRRGPVCCYSVVLVKLLDGKSVSTLPEPHFLPLLTYEEVHRQGAGAYIAEMFDADRLPADGVSLGDNSTIDKANPPCKSCPGIFRGRRSAQEATPPPPTGISTDLLSFDGPLSPDSNYTMFIRLFSAPSQDRMESVYSPYASPLTPKPTLAPPHSADRSVVLVVALGVLCGLALVLLVIVSSLLFLRRYSKHVAQSEGVEMSLSSSCRHLWSRFRDGGRHLLVSPQASASAAPIAKGDLVDAFVLRHQNADYGFQHEYEMLPDRFADRTTRASDTRENMPKNRYPDIKAYDQTRVKLNLTNGDPNSDYINANFVMGYKERKKFVCAQGPMECTVHDFWRMAWEQRVEIIVMLTNVEEYNKTKCFQYWPDPDPSRGAPTPEPLYIDPVAESTLPRSNGGTLSSHSPSNGSTVATPEQTQQQKTVNAPKGQGDKTFGDIRVIHVKEKRYSEYVVRELQVSRPKVGTPTDPELGVMEREVRPVFQYHYLVWKDFQAPEHATGILRFLRRLNEDYSTDRGPILIHCSAGVGRTGTLVAIDHLIQQIDEEGCISVLNTVCDLRHQRNFLVQSMRQYIFVYRALMEYVQFGNTEVSVANFQDSYADLKKKIEGRTACLLDDEFLRLDQLVEDRKPMSVASSEENKAKNRYEAAVPFDRNRVILTPVPGRDFSTYINASFVEGYDNSESFILTQDPIESTQRDFWRMVLEHNVVVVVMLSEMGDADPSQCPQYWPDDDKEATHDNIVVKHISTVTLPSYIQRDFIVRNIRNREEIRTTQIQYLGWGQRIAASPTGVEDDTVPQQAAQFVTVALETIGARARQLQGGSVCIHCSTGNVRSSVLAALCVLIEQARTEGYVDVFGTVRKLRSQRMHMIQHSTQYSFLYEALAYYLRTHPSSVPPSP